MNHIMCFFIIIGLILIIIGLVMIFIYWPTWPTGVALIAVGLVAVVLFGWAYKKIFTDKIDRDPKA
jgi:membrane protein implicated in regulation of membrane protease activity